jgi:hypothetical protein
MTCIIYYYDVSNHNYAINNDPTPNSPGFDLLFTDNANFTHYGVGVLINHNIKCNV